MNALLKKLLWQLIRIGIALFPVIGYEIALRVQFFPVFWPPLGPFDNYGIAPATAIIAVIGWALPGRFKTKAAQEWALNISIGLAVVAFLVYVYMFMAFVRSVETPSYGTQYRSIGTQRNAQIVTKFPNMTDEELLEVAGLEEKGIRKIWKSESVTLARSGLFISYFFTLALSNLAIGLHLRQLSDPLAVATPRP
jgi:low affinity Fe/Cu permease